MSRRSARVPKPVKRNLDDDDDQKQKKVDDAEDDEDDSTPAPAAKASKADKIVNDQPLAGTNFLVSGKFALSQKEMTEKLEQLGATVAKGFSKAVTHCVASEKGSTKAAQCIGQDKFVITEACVEYVESNGKFPDDDDDKYYFHKPGAGSNSSSSQPKAKKSKASKKQDPDPDQDDQDDDDNKDTGANDNNSNDPPAKVKTVVVKGRAPVDEHCPNHSSYHVYQEGKDVYDCMLNQTNIGNNNNKFYVIQLLESDTSKSYAVWNRWGRVGAPGQSALKPFNGNLSGAKAEFCSKFHDKTKNRWDNRANFESYSGKYTLIERDFSADDDLEKQAELEQLGQANKERLKNIPDSKLDKRVQDFVKLICNIDMMKEAMVEIGYDANKLPLGKLSKETIKRGYDALKRIADTLDGKAKENLTELSNVFYTNIPHVTKGMRPPPVINSSKLLKDKLQMVEALADIEIATKLLKSNLSSTVNPIDEQYEKLNSDMVPLEAGPELDMVKKYVANTHGHTHNQYKLEVDTVFKINRKGEDERFKPWEKTENRQLLWHGSRLTNWCGILSQGLRIAPPEAPVTGYMFGKGVYFADMVSKSANYCCTSRTANTGVMLLCEVALGKESIKYGADYYAANLPAGCLSTKGVGANAPNDAERTVLEDGLIVPNGHGVPQKLDQNSSLLYNEFIVYDVSQIKCKYLLKLKFKYN